MLWDTHMHTRYSGDSDAAPEAMAEAAVHAGLGGICLTDHYDWGYPNDPEMFLLDFEGYRRDIAALRAKYDGRLSVLWGVELGLVPEAAAENRRIAGGFPFDFIIGSSHVVNGVDPYYPAY
ncbi:MAG: PHP domain-containing protein, partial [Clostridiales bacterium]|nr:PHP domain-containing protein [Clostridiales bacterium]